jgi:hypothetical protein
VSSSPSPSAGVVAWVLFPGDARIPEDFVYFERLGVAWDSLCWGRDHSLRITGQQQLTAGKSSIAAALVDVLHDRGVKCTVASLDGTYMPHPTYSTVATDH